MAVWQAVVLGIVQGVTEVLPVSSSAHLVFVPKLLGLAHPPLAFDVLLHLGTLLAVAGYFARDLVRLIREAWQGRSEARRLFLLLLIGSVPAGVFGVLAHDWIERAFAAPAATAWQLAFTGFLVILAERRGAGGKDLDAMGPADALFIGVGQALAVVPGISRSGATIAFGLWRGLGRTAAARFSFLLSIPAILGAGLVESRSLAGAAGGKLAFPYFFGFIAAAVAGTVSIAFFLRHLSRGRLRPFAVYCWAAAGAFLLYLALS
ncbi:MAG: undecaprenyl-diphosphate phosphatase [Firmicutes bacterium]|nr:undecaprenyl-diphosphate phosphatase [Bacillota bacterium]